jgi:hypothetical protein
MPFSPVALYSRWGTWSPGRKPMAWDEDDDWVGEPPEGRHSADRARPEFWRLQRPPEVVALALLAGLIVLAVVLVLR